MKRTLILLLLFSLILSGCASAAPTFESGAAPAPAAPMERPAAADKAFEAAGVSSDQAQDLRKVIYSADMTLIVTDTEAVADQITQMANDLGGYVANLNAFRSDNLMYYSITLRVPAEQFDNARAALRNMALRVDNDSIGSDDVTDQYYDIEARLRALRATETELISLLRETRERGGKVEDIMSIYRELTQIQSQIESQQGQLNRLDKLVSLSTINITLRPDELAKPIATDEWRPLQTLRDSARDLVNVLQGLIDLLIRLLVVVLPTLIFLAIPVLLILLALRWLTRRLRGKSGGGKPSGDKPAGGSA
ncbi:MAG: DUF4349 domain-containing protein [Caldilineales bacterium]|nr:DUF4349 domain-containing protein [Caldilineales bacterium]